MKSNQIFRRIAIGLRSSRIDFSIVLLAFAILGTTGCETTDTNSSRNDSIGLKGTSKFTIISDGDTWISLNGPMILKARKVKRTTFDLLPGFYKITARKNEFKTVKIGIKVESGKKYEPYEVFCTENWNMVSKSLNR